MALTLSKPRKARRHCLGNLGALSPAVGSPASLSHFPFLQLPSWQGAPFGLRAGAGPFCAGHPSEVPSASGALSTLPPGRALKSPGAQWEVAVSPVPSAAAVRWQAQAQKLPGRTPVHRRGWPSCRLRFCLKHDPGFGGAAWGCACAYPPGAAQLGWGPFWVSKGLSGAAGPTLRARQFLSISKKTPPSPRCLPEFCDPLAQGWQSPKS